MANFAEFMKANKKVKENVRYAVTKSLVGADGKPLEWELRPVTTRLNDQIREACTVEVQVKGKPNMFRQKFDSAAYQSKLLVSAIVYPDLNNKELQNSYGVLSPEELLKEMVDDAGEYTDLMLKVQEISGFTTLAEDVEDAKN